MKFILLLILSLLLNLSFAQKKQQDKFSNLIIGGNYTYIFDYDVIGGIDYQTLYKEHTIAANVAVDVTKSIRVGFDTKRIFTKSVHTGSNQYQLNGLFGQYKVYKFNKGFVFSELGFYKGNYCTCGDDMPFKKKVNYLGWGIGYNRKLYKNIYLDAAFINHQVLLKRTEIPYAYTQYVLGIDYLLPIKKK